MCAIPAKTNSTTVAYWLLPTPRDWNNDAIARCRIALSTPRAIDPVQVTAGKR